MSALNRFLLRAKVRMLRKHKSFKKYILSRNESPVTFNYSACFRVCDATRLYASNDGNQQSCNDEGGSARF